VKIACIIHSLDGGGAERVMASLASRLAARQHAVTLITLDDGARDRHSVDADVVRRPLDMMCESRGLAAKFLHTRYRIKGLRAAILDEAPDVVLSFCDRTNILTLMAAKNLGIPVIISERSDPQQQSLGTIWEHLRTRTYRRATAIIALTETSARYLTERLGSAVDVIPSAVDAPPLESDREMAIRQRRIIAAGRLEHEKGFDRLVDAFAMIADKSPDWSLRILGEGSMRTSLEKQIRDHGLADRVTLAGWIRPIWDELAASTIFALPSRYEGFPSALLEAMAAGVPSIAVDCESGPRSIMGDSNGGLLVANDVAALADGIQQLIEDDGQREQLGADGKHVVERFGWDPMVDAYEAILCRAADEKKPRHEGARG
jgi:GalNAc-alpha-(1->4)-GalNAc-alpha-(1->3)-diNAcBac-PP-undecaprenol alpha-1,4-N-acetyl-D-galactosaminyltransferase